MLDVLPLDSFKYRSEDLPYLYRMLSEVYHLCPSLWILFIGLSIVEAFIPAATLYFSGQLFQIIQSAVEKREADTNMMMRVAIGTAICTIAGRLTRYWDVRSKIIVHINDHYEAFFVHCRARLDVPTAADPIIRDMILRHSNSNGSGGLPWALTSRIISLATMCIQLFSQLFMLVGLLREQKDSASLVFWSFAGPILQWLEKENTESFVSIFQNEHMGKFKASQLATRVDISQLRQEIVAGNLGNYLTRKYRDSKSKYISPPNDKEVWDRSRNVSFSKFHVRLLRDALAEGPKIAFAFNALRTPSTIPLSLATLTVVQDQVNKFSTLLLTFLSSKTSLSWQLASIKEMYNLDQIPNQIKDGDIPFPATDLEGGGIEVEFKDVSFRYPNADKYAIRNVSFRVPAGGLCVIVGANGQGKSSILKLLTRLYDPSAGEILLDGKPIYTYRLADLRKATTVLFQDFSLFGLSVEENIGMGDPDASEEDIDYIERINRAAGLGGAKELIDNLPQGLKSYPTQYDSSVDIINRGPQSIEILSAAQKQYNLRIDHGSELSGGQKQRLALARTFMRRPRDVSLLLYDEPSAALDPQAEYDLFQRLKVLRESKTMIFSTHRFGYLTRHADVILFLKNSTVVEAGTHNELMLVDGGYAQLYRIQAQAFAG